MRIPIFCRVFALLLLFLSPLRAETPSEIANPLQTNRSWVADSAGVLSSEDERRINAILSPLERKNGAEVAVVTVHNLGGKSVEEFGNELFRLWKIGKKGRDNGVLVLVAIDDRKSRIEVGYGLEDVLPDGKTGAILREKVTPQLRNGAYGAGLLAGALALSQEIDPSFNAPTAATRPASPQPEVLRSPAIPPPSQSVPSQSFPSPNFENFPRNSSPSSQSGGALVAIFGLFMLLCPVLFIGGIIWFVVSLMRRPPRCPKCKTPMQQIPDAIEARSLSPIQRFEQEIGARDYKVWNCPACQTETISGHNTMFSAYADCPACRNRTARSTTQILQHPTEWTQGTEQITVTCEWPNCRHSGSYTRPIARLASRSNDLAAGAVIGSVLGSSHHSSGSSSSSSNDSPSSSFDSGPSNFGGGDSGGGGASNSW